jgi:ribosome-associated toxin RatA of RatAB toxin-antitoxin module
VHSEVTTWISAPPDEVFELVADVARWPEHLPHYRYVRVLRRSAGEVLAAMSARRGWIPVFWCAAQTADSAARTVRFRHVRGITRGMEVLWTFEPEDGGTRARLFHDLDLRWPFVGDWLARHVIEKRFVRPIAFRTMRRFKEVAEAASADEATAAAVGGG